MKEYKKGQPNLKVNKENIDKDIFPLVNAINNLNNIDTTASCQGHFDLFYQPGTYLAFKSENDSTHFAKYLAKSFSKFRRSSSLYGAFSWVNARTKILGNQLLLSKRMGPIKIKREREFPPGSSLRSLRIKKENDKFFVSFVIKFEVEWGWIL